MKRSAHLVQEKGEKGEVQGRVHVSLVEVMVERMFPLQLQRGSRLCWFSTSVGCRAEVVEGSHYLLRAPQY